MFHVECHKAPFWVLIFHCYAEKVTKLFLLMTSTCFPLMKDTFMTIISPKGVSIDTNEAISQEKQSNMKRTLQRSKRSKPCAFVTDSLIKNHYCGVLLTVSPNRTADTARRQSEAKKRVYIKVASLHEIPVGMVLICKPLFS